MRHLGREPRGKSRESRAALVSPGSIIFPCCLSNDNGANDDGSDNDTRRADRRVRFADRIDHPFASALGRPQIDKQHLIFVVLDDFTERMPTFGKVDRIKLALEDRILQMLAKVPHRLEDFAKTLVVTDIVSDQIGISHGRVSHKGQARTLLGGRGILLIVIGGNGDANKAAFALSCTYCDGLDPRIRVKRQRRCNQSM